MHRIHQSRRHSSSCLCILFPYHNILITLSFSCLISNHLVAGLVCGLFPTTLRCITTLPTFCETHRNRTVRFYITSWPFGEYPERIYVGRFRRCDFSCYEFYYFKVRRFFFKQMKIFKFSLFNMLARRPNEDNSSMRVYTPFWLWF